MSQPYFFNHSIRNLIVAFCEAFKDVHVKRYDDEGNVSKDILVPIKFGPFAKTFMRRTEDGSMQRYYTQLPTMSVTLQGFSFSAERSRSSMVRRYLPKPDFDFCNPDKVLTDMMPSPWDVNFTLHIKTESFVDFTQIVEQIAPWFNPSCYLQVKEFNTINLNRNVRITLNGLNTEFTEPVEEEGKRYVNGTMEFTADYQFYKPLSDSSVIEKIRMHYGYEPDYNLGEDYETDGELWKSISATNVSGTSSKGELDGGYISNPLIIDEELGYMKYKTSADDAGHSSKTVPEHGKFRKRGDHLYEITYAKYPDLSSVTSGSDDLDIAEQGCAACENGNFVGRNLDLVCSSACDIVVHTTKTEDRFASVALCGGVINWNSDFLHTGMNGDEEQFGLVPWAVMDGINENGVFVCSLTVPVGQGDNNPTSGTNQSAEESLNLQFIPRYILDNAESVEDAITKLNSLNITNELYDFFKYRERGFEAHFLVSDDERTVVVEFVNNNLVVNDVNVATNFYESNEDHLHSRGKERFGILEEGITSATNASNMMKLLETVKYSNAYTNEQDNFWWTDHYGSLTDKETGETIDITNENVDQYKDKIVESCVGYNPDTEDRTLGWKKTWHSVVYNKKNMSFDLCRGEDYTKTYRFTLT